MIAPLSLVTCPPFLTCAIEHFVEFHSNPISSIASLADFNTLFSFLSEAANIFRSSMYKRCVIEVLTGLLRRYPFVAASFHATGLIHSVKRRRPRASPCGKPLLNLIRSDSS